MNRIIAGLAVAGAIVSAAPQAHADPGTDHGNAQFVYTVDLARAGITGPMYQEILVGETICDNLAHGMPIAQTITRLIPVPGMTPQMAVTIVSAAVMDLCPQYAPAQTPTASPPVDPPHVTIASAIA